MLVSVVQFCPSFKEVRRNLQKLASLIIQAGEKGAKIAVLPELCLTGYSFMSQKEAEPFAEIISDFKPQTKNPVSSMSVFYALARKYNMHIAWGLVEKDSGTGRLHNSQVLMCPDGSFETMRKINSFANDFLWATEGRANPPIRKITIDDETRKVGLLICRDVRDKKDDKWKDFYEKGDADLVLLSAAWGKGGFPANAWMDFVKENEATLAISNRYGIEANNDFGNGGIGIIKPDGKVQCEGLVWNQDCIVFGEI
jgi:predicted amidohydrolase